MSSTTDAPGSAAAHTSGSSPNLPKSQIKVIYPRSSIFSSFFPQENLAPLHPSTTTESPSQTQLKSQLKSHKMDKDLANKIKKADHFWLVSVLIGILAMAPGLLTGLYLSAPTAMYWVIGIAVTGTIIGIPYLYVCSSHMVSFPTAHSFCSASS